MLDVINISLIVAGLLIAFLSVLVLLTISYFILHYLFRDPLLKPTTIDYSIQTYISSIFAISILIVYNLVRLVFVAIQGVIVLVNNNLYLVVGLTIILLGSFVWLEYHDVGLKAYLIFRQCIIRYGIDFIISDYKHSKTVIYNFYRFLGCSISYI